MIQLLLLFLEGLLIWVLDFKYNSLFVSHLLNSSFLPLLLLLKTNRAKCVYKNIKHSLGRQILERKQNIHHLYNFQILFRELPFLCIYFSLGGKKQKANKKSEKNKKIKPSDKRNKMNTFSLDKSSLNLKALVQKVIS